MATTKTADYATLTLWSNSDTAAAGTSFTFTVAPTLKAGKNLYQPEAIYKLFVHLPKGLTAQLPVKYASGTAQVAEAEKSWTGAPGEYATVQDTWDKGSDQQAEAYDLRLLATWKSSSFTDTTNTHPLGWDIEVKVDASHGSTPAAIQATLMVMQDGHVKSALSADPLTIDITSAGPAFASVTLPDADKQGSQFIMPAATNEPFRVRAVLAAAAAAERMLVRWQVKGAGDSWNLAEPHELEVTGGKGGTQLRDFTIQNNFTTAATLLFSCAVPVSGSDLPNWGVPFSVNVDFESGLLNLDSPVVKVSGSKIFLTCTISEPTTHVQFNTLEVSFDGGGRWLPVSSGITGSSPTYTVNYEISERDFSHGVRLRAKDKFNRAVLKPARFDIATFLTVAWSGQSTTNEDINLGEMFFYVIKLNCALDTILPPSTIDIQLPELAVEAAPTGTNAYLIQEPGGALGSELFFFPSEWRGAGTATFVYQGPIRSGALSVTCLVRENSVLLGQVLPAAQLIVSGEDYLTQPLEYNETPKAKVFRPAPVFQFIQLLPVHTNRYALNFKGNFTPALEPSPDLVFAIRVDSSGEKTLPAGSLTTLTPGYFEFSLKNTEFREFDADGEHHVRLTVHRRADTRIAQRSSHSEILTLNIDNGAASFENTSVQVESNYLRLDGTVIAPSVNNPVKQVLLDWDGSGQGTAQKPVTLNKEDDLHSSFTETLALTAFNGTLHPVLRAFTSGNVETSLNVFFATARYLLDIEVKINNGIVNDEGNTTVNPGTVSFDIAVTSMAGLPQKLNMFMTLGKSFLPGKIATTTPPLTNYGKLNPTSPPNSWNGISSYQFFQTEGLVKGAKFGVSGTIGLKKVARASSEDETLSISFTETDPFTKQTFNSIDKDDGVIFKVQLIPQ